MGSSYMSATQVGMNGFHMAINRGHYETAKLLLDAGVDPAECKDKGETPLHIVTQRGHAHLILLLIKMGAEANAKSNIHRKILPYSHPGYEERPRSSLGFRDGRDGLISAIDDDIEAPLHHA
jgi:ankyrin repeat protein